MGGTPNPVTMPEGERGKAVCLLPLNQPLPSTLPALCSSWPFPFVCLSGDNGRLSVTQGLTQIHSVRRRTGSRMMGISQPLFTHETNPPQSKPQSSQRLQAALLQGKKADWSAMQTSSNQLIRLVTHGRVLTYSWPALWNKGHRDIVNLRTGVCLAKIMELCSPQSDLILDQKWQHLCQSARIPEWPCAYLST